MNHITLHQAVPSARSSAVPTDHIAEELRFYDAHLRDVRGLAAGTREDYIRVAGLLPQQKFVECPVVIAKLRPDDVRRFLASQLDAH
ncbi:MAG: hypothetical protein ABI144_02905 [Gallionella sp.]